jgi:hypothetical protein
MRESERENLEYVTNYYVRRITCKMDTKNALVKRAAATAAVKSENYANDLT